MMQHVTLALALLVSAASPAQSKMGNADPGAHKPASKPSSELMLSGLSGVSRTLTPADLKALPHVTVNVHNAHTNKDESYSGVPVRDLLALVEPAKGAGPRMSPNMQILVAGATDGFQVALTLCDTNPECRSGQAIVADTQESAPLGKDGAFKLILTEDKKPARWVRNLQSLTVKAVSAN